MAASSTGGKLVIVAILCSVTSTGFCPTFGGDGKRMLARYFVVVTAASGSTCWKLLARPLSATTRDGKLASRRACPGRVVAILPGSRTQEVTENLPVFLKAAGRIRQAVPDVRFLVAAFSDKHAELARTLAAAAITFGALSLAGASLTMASVGVADGKFPARIAVATARARSIAWRSIQSFATLSRILASGAGAAGMTCPGETST